MSLIWRACGRAARSCAAGRHKKGGASIKTQNPLLWNVSNGSQGSSVSLPHSLKHWNYMQTKIFSSHFYRKYFHCFPEFKLELGLQKYFAHMVQIFLRTKLCCFTTNSTRCYRMSPDIFIGRQKLRV